MHQHPDANCSGKSGKPGTRSLPLCSMPYARLPLDQFKALFPAFSTPVCRMGDEGRGARRCELREQAAGRDRAADRAPAGAERRGPFGRRQRDRYIGRHQL